MKKLHYGWLVCAGCALLLFCTSGLAVNAFTVYQPYILQQNGFTNMQSSSIITVRSLFSFVAMFLTDRYYRRLSLRKGMGLSGALIVAGFVIYGCAATHLTYCVGAALVGLAYGFGTMIPISIVLEHWFASKRTLAIGICSAVTGVSTLGIPSGLTWLIETCGLQYTFLLEAAVMGLLLGAAVLLIRDDPAQMGLQPYGLAEAEAAARKLSTGSLLRSRHWAVIVPMLLLLGAMTSVAYSHLSVLVSSEGFHPQVTALAITVSGIMMTLGKFAYGWSADRLGTYRSHLLFGGVLIVGLSLSCMMNGSTVMLFGSMCCYGWGLATTTVGLTAWAGDLSTAEEYDANVRRFQLGYAAGTLVFSSLPGLLADRFGGSYQPAFVFFTLCAVFVVLSVQWLYRSTGQAGKGA